MNPAIELQCPQCGGPIHLEETDRLLRCPSCGVQHVIMTADRFRYVFSAEAQDRPYLYLPYLRFKGTVFVCRLQGTEHRVLDITHAGHPLNGLPPSLGLRPQALKMHFLTDRENAGRFLNITERPTRILEKAGQLSDDVGPGSPLFHRVYIGEAVSIIYLPVFARNGRLHDGLTCKHLADLPAHEQDLLQDTRPKPDWKVTLLAALCPDCGWNLSGERDSVVLTCENCRSAWEIQGETLVRLPVLTIPASGTRVLYLPFWRSTIESRGIDMRSFADLIRVTRQPMIIDGAWERTPLAFWAPAFKVQPKIFLALARRITLSQQQFEPAPHFPDGAIHPVTLPSSEAAQSFKLTLAESALSRREVLRGLPQTHFDKGGPELVYLPFEEDPHDLIHQGLGFAINRRALAFGRSL